MCVDRLLDATDDTATTPFETPVTIDVLDNDTPVDGVAFDPSTLVLVDSDGNEVIKLILTEGIFEVVDGKVTFTPADGFSGQVPNVTYCITDVDGNTVEAVIRVTVDS